MNHQRSLAFTLVELLLVVILMACVLTMAVTNFPSVFSGMELKTSADDLASLIRYAQGRVVTGQVVMRLIFTDDFKGYRLQEAPVDEQGEAGEFVNSSSRLGRLVHLPRSVTAVSENKEIKIYPDGSLDRVRIALKSKDKQITLSTMEQRGYVFVIDE